MVHDRVKLYIDRYNRCLLPLNFVASQQLSMIIFVSYVWGWCFLTTTFALQETNKKANKKK